MTGNTGNTGRDIYNSSRVTFWDKYSPFIIVGVVIILLFGITFFLVSQDDIAKAGVKNGNTMIRLQESKATQLKPLHPNCQEDEAWVPVPHDTPNSIQDINGTSRACIHLDDLANSN